MRVRVAEVLPERLGVLDADLRAARGGPLGLALKVLVDPVLPEQPVPLAGVAGQHPPLDLEDRRDVHEKPRRLWPPVAVDPLDRVDKIEVGDLRQGGRGVPLSGRVVGDRRGEAGVAHEDAGHLVVAEVIDRRGRQHDVGPGPPQALRHPPPRLVVVEDRQVAELQAKEVGADPVGRLFGLGPPGRGDRLGVVLGAAAVAGGHRRHRDVAPRLAQQRERPRALKFQVVRVGVQGEDSRRFGRGHRSVGSSGAFGWRPPCDCTPFQGALKPRTLPCQSNRTGVLNRILPIAWFHWFSRDPARFQPLGRGAKNPEKFSGKCSRVRLASRPVYISNQRHRW